MTHCKVALVVVGLLFAFSHLARAQNGAISPDGRRLADALAKLKSNPDDPAAQKQYLDSFPQNYRAFERLFEPGRELYDGGEFIKLLPSLARDNESDVGTMLIHLSEDAHYEADAPSYLQQATALYASMHTRTFVILLKQLPIERRAHVVVFLADVENHAAYKEYQAIIGNLKSLGESCLANDFETARSQREAQSHT